MVIHIGRQARGAARPLFDELNRLYLEAGAPSLRAIAEQTTGISRSAIHRALTSDTVPSWTTLHAIVTALNGDTATVRVLWRAAVEGREPSSVDEPTPSTETYGEVEAGSLRVVLVDDHEIVRQGLRDLLEDEGIEIVGEADHVDNAVTVVLETRPDVTVMDVRLPVGNGIDATAEIRAQWPQAKVIVLTSYSDEAAMLGAIQAGAAGFVLKQVLANDLLQAIRAVAAGGTAWLHPRAAELAANPANRTRPLPGGHRAPLSQRELSVLTLMSQGMTNRQICIELAISLSTVETHVSRVMTKLHVATRVEAVLYAIKHGLVAGPV